MIDLAPPHHEIVVTILQRHVPNARVWAFGSRVNGTAKKHSDLDLAILAGNPLSLNQLGQLREAFAESDLPMKVDVIDFHSVDPAFQRIIEQSYVQLTLSNSATPITHP